MPTTVDIPDIGEVDFPDSMSEDEISKASSKLYSDARAAKTPANPARQFGTADDDLAAQMQAGAGRTVTTLKPAPTDTGYGEVFQSLGSGTSPDLPLPGPDNGTMAEVYNGNLARAGGRAADSPMAPLSRLVPSPQLVHDAMAGLIDAFGQGTTADLPIAPTEAPQGTPREAAGLPEHIASGALSGLAGLAEGLTTPKNLALIAAAAAVPAPFARVVAGLFGADMLASLPELYRHAKDSVKSGDAKDIADAVVRLAGTAYMGGLAATHAATTPKTPLDLTLDQLERNTRQPIPEQLAIEAADAAARPVPQAEPVQPAQPELARPAETPAPQPGISPGPGGAAAGEPGTYDPRQQAIDAMRAAGTGKTGIQALKSDIGWKVKIAEDLIDPMRPMVDSAMAAVGATRGYARQIFKQLPKLEDLERSVGALDYALQKSSALNRELQKVMKQRVLDETDRSAMAFAMEKSDPAEVAKILEDNRLGVLTDKDGNAFKLKPKVERAMKRYLELRPEVLQEVEGLVQLYGQRGMEAQQSGVLNDLLDNYYTHVWRAKQTAGLPAKLASGIARGEVDTFFPYSRKRTFDQLLDGIRLGYEPVLDVADVLPHYGHILDRAIASREFVKSLGKLREADGRPTVSLTGMVKPVGEVVQGEVLPGVTGDFYIPGAKLVKPSAKPSPGKDALGEPIKVNDYRTIDHPAMKGWRYIDKSKDGGVPIYLESDLAVHPAAYQRLYRMMDRNALRPSNVTRKLLNVSAQYKGFKLSAVPSPFHQVHVGLHALAHGNFAGVFKSMFSRMDSNAIDIDWHSPSVQFAIEKGHLKLAPEAHELHLFDENFIAKGMLAHSKINPLGHISKIYGEYIFTRYIPHLKLTTFELVNARNLKWYAKELAAGKVTRDQLAARAGDTVNNAFGELNRKWLGAHGRDPRFQRLLQGLFLAPDFGEARIGFIAKAFTKYGKEERHALIAMAGTLYISARVANLISTGDPQWSPKHFFEVKMGDKWVGVRSVVGDVGHLVSDWRRFLYHRLSVYGRGILEFGSGVDMGGHARTFTEKLKDIGIESGLPLPASGLTEPDRNLFDTVLQGVGIQRHPDFPDNRYYFVRGRNVTTKAGFEDYLNQVAHDARTQKNPSAYVQKRLTDDGVDAGKRKYAIQQINGKLNRKR